MEVGTDVSDLGWGLYFQGQMRQGLWLDIADAPDHIDVKELMVLHIFLWDFLPFPVTQSLSFGGPTATPHVLNTERRWHNISTSPLFATTASGTSGSFLCLGRFSGGGGARRAGPGVELSVPSPSNSPSRHSENSQALSPCDSILASPSLVSSPAGLGHCGRLLASGDASSVGPVDGVTPTSLSPPCLANFWRH